MDYTRLRRIRHMQSVQHQRNQQKKTAVEPEVKN